MHLKVAIIQAEISGNKLSLKTKKNNLSRIFKLIEQVINHNPDLIILPDEFLSGYAYGPANLTVDLEEEVFPLLGKVAKDHNTFIAGSALNKVKTLASYSMGFIIDNQGILIGSQYRMHTYVQESRFVMPGQKINLIETPFGKVGFLIGLDLLYPELAREMTSNGADILLAPIYVSSQEFLIDGHVYNYPGNLYQIAAQARAMENVTFVIMANAVGQHCYSKKPIFGGSMIVGPYGPILELGNEETVGCVTIGNYSTDYYIEPVSNRFRKINHA